MTSCILYEGGVHEGYMTFNKAALVQGNMLNSQSVICLQTFRRHMQI